MIVESNAARSRLAHVIGAGRWSPPTGTKSMAWADAKRVVPWLGTRSAGLLRTSHLPAKGRASSIVIVTGSRRLVPEGH